MPKACRRFTVVEAFLKGVLSREPTQTMINSNSQLEKDLRAHPTTAAGDSRAFKGGGEVHTMRCSLHPGQCIRTPQVEQTLNPQPSTLDPTPPSLSLSRRRHTRLSQHLMST